MELNAVVEQVHNLAREKGWHDENLRELKLHDGKLPPKSLMTLLMLIVSEAAEGCEEVRTKTPYLYWNTPHGRVTSEDCGNSSSLMVGMDVQKPEGLRSELADVVIRVMDVFGLMGWNLEADILAKHEFNKHRAFKHGGKCV